MSLQGNQKQSGYNFTMLNTTITTAITAVPLGTITGLAGAKHITLQSILTYGSGGTNCKVWLQTSVDYGVTWFDIMNHAFLTATLTKVGSCSAHIGLTPATPTDGTLADNTATQGIMGDRFRIKLTTTGTYAGGTTLKVTGNIKG